VTSARVMPRRGRRSGRGLAHFRSVSNNDICCHIKRYITYRDNDSYRICLLIKLRYLMEMIRTPLNSIQCRWSATGARGAIGCLVEWQAMAEARTRPTRCVPRRRTARSSRPFANRVGSRTCRRSKDDPRLHRGSREGGQEPATIRRYVATVSRVHTAAGLLNPCSSEAVHLGLKKWSRTQRARTKRILDWKDIKELSRAPAKACALIASEHCSASPTKP